MEDEHKGQDGGDDASVSACESSDVTLAGEENSTVMTMFQALMTEMKVHAKKIYQQATTVLDQQVVEMDDQAAQIRELVAEFSQVKEEVVTAQEPPELERQLCGVIGHCMTLPGPVMSTITVGGVEEKLPVFMADMEEPCLLGLCDDLGGMQR